MNCPHCQHCQQPSLPPIERPLSPRQRQVLDLLSKGLTNGECASILGCGLATVRSHVEEILRRLDVTNRTEAVAEALRRGLVTG